MAKYTEEYYVILRVFRQQIKLELIFERKLNVQLQGPI